MYLWLEWGGESKIRICGETPSAFFLRSLLSWDWQKATWRYQMILVSPRFSTLTNLVQSHLKLQVMWRHWCILIATRVCWFYDIPDAHANSRGHTSALPPPRCTWTYLILTIYEALPMGKHLRIVYFWKQVYSLFILGNRYISCYAIHANYAACQRDLQDNIQHYSAQIADSWVNSHQYICMKAV